MFSDSVSITRYRSLTRVAVFWLEKDAKQTLILFKSNHTCYNRPKLLFAERDTIEIKTYIRYDLPFREKDAFKIRITLVHSPLQK